MGGSHPRRTDPVAVKSRLSSEGAEVVGNTPEHAAAGVRADLEKWVDVVRRTNIRLD